MTVATFERTHAAARRNSALAMLRRGLDTAYAIAGYAAAACLAGILVVTLVQIVTRYLDFPIRGLSDYAGYLMAASAFLAFPMAFNRGAHVRVEMALAALGRYRRAGEIVAFGASAAIASWFAYYACRMVYYSWAYGDISTGMDATPLWIPQTTMALGAVLFAVAIIDQLMQLVFRGRHSMAQSSGLE